MTKMIKLVQINSAINKGSTGKIAEQIGVIAKKKGWNSYIIHSSRYANETSLTDISTSTPLGEKCHYLGSLLFDSQGLYSRTSTKKVVRALEEIHPSIIHLHNIHGYYINFRILFDYIKSTQIPTIWTLHDCWPFTGHCVYFDRIGCEKWKTHCKQCMQKNGYPKSIIDRCTRNYELKRKLFTSVPNMTIVPVSNWLHSLVEQSYLVKFPIRTIHNGIDIEKFKPCDSNFRKRYSLENKFVILGVADGYGQRKGISDFNTLSEKLDDDMSIVMVGLSESDKKQIGPKIVGMGRTNSQQELIDIYSAADVFINPTYEDNFPTTNLEALACGTPVITYKTGGSPEAINELTGFVIDKGDVDSLASAIELVKKNGKSSFTMSCRERALKYFNKDDRFEDYFKLYNELLI